MGTAKRVQCVRHVIALGQSQQSVKLVAGCHFRLVLVHVDQAQQISDEASRLVERQRDNGSGITLRSAANLSRTESHDGGRVKYRAGVNMERNGARVVATNDKIALKLGREA